ncbi:MAG: ABC transporter ATP-binding protein [Lachnospiraceae bacterium]|nr:ABC transporter ATP-binding protein [Lachnospiraceae bacterium]
MLKVTHLSKAYGDRKVLRDISFEAEKGKIYGFLGPNGVGKSTTMNLITGYLAPDKGNILINDISLFREPARAKRQIGYLPEQPPLYPDLTVRESLMFAAELKGLEGKAAAAEVDRVGEKLKLKYVYSHLTKQISKGFKQRVGLAQALIADPEIIILDEPSSGLDPRQIVEMRELVRSLKEDHTVIFSTHILSEVESLCDHVMVLSGGKLVADDTPEQLLFEVNEQQHLRIVLSGSSTAAERAIDLLEHVESHRVLKEDSFGSTIEVCAERGKDIRAALSRACIEAGYTILELENKQVSLEEVYLELTQSRDTEEEEEAEDAGDL